MTRVAKAMNLSLVEAMERVNDVNEPFYRRALKSTRAKLGTNQVSQSTLEKAQQSLGISEETAFDMHVACLNEEVRDLLGLQTSDEEETADVDTATAKFRESARERVRRKIYKIYLLCSWLFRILTFVSFPNSSWMN